MTTISQWVGKVKRKPLCKHAHSTRHCGNPRCKHYIGKARA
jgi:hypothetical protein